MATKWTAEQQKAIVFFMMFALADCEKIAIENPQGIMSTAYRKADCTYNPYDFEGETECKKTCLWLKGLEPLKPTREIPLAKEERTQGIWKAHFGDRKLAWNDPETARMRSVTPLGVAKAMAEQWGQRKENEMKELFMKLLWFFYDDDVVIEGISLHEGRKYSDMDIVYMGKKYNITIRKEDEEDA